MIFSVSHKTKTPRETKNLPHGCFRSYTFMYYALKYGDWEPDVNLYMNNCLIKHIKRYYCAVGVGDFTK